MISKQWFYQKKSDAKAQAAGFANRTHGKRSTYRAGCRCEDCKLAKSLSRKQAETQEAPLIERGL